MMHATVLQDSFNRGELSPLTHMRSEAEWYLDGVKTMQNFLPVPRGAIRRRTGFRYLGQVALDDNTQQIFPQTTRLSITTPAVNVS